MGGLGLGPNDPLIDQAVKNLIVGLWLAIEELLVAGQGANVAPKNDVVLHASHDAIQDFLRRERILPAGESGRDSEHENSEAAHQKLDPKLKKI